MANGNRKQKILVKIGLGVVVAFLGIGMLLYLVPGQPGVELTGADVVAQVGNQSITVSDVQDQLSRIEQNGQIPQSILPLYAQQVLQQLIYAKSLDLEAARLGVKVTDAEHAARLRELVPTAFSGNTFVGMDRYSTEVQQRFQMDVPQFESLVKEELLEQKFEQLVTDGINVTDAEVKEEFRRRNEKIKIQYAVIKPEDLQSKINPTDAELSDYFGKNKARYVIPERRTVDYAILDLAKLEKTVPVTEAEMKQYYQAHLDQYKIQDKAEVAHILFKTVGKTDAEIAEIKKKAEDVLNKAKHGANFANLAKQYSEDDATKIKGGDLGWIVRGQTVKAFENAAFNLPKGSISDLVKTPYGFDIIKVLDRQVARTKSFDEVKSDIETQLRKQKAQQTAQTISSNIADEILRAGRIPIADLAKKYNLETGEAKLVQANQPLPEVGNGPGVLDAIFRLRVGDVSAPLQTDKGYVILSVKDIYPAHQAKLDEVRDQVLGDYRHDKAAGLAKTDAQHLAKQLKSGANFASAAKAMGFTVTTSDPFARTGSVPNAGSAQLFSAAFNLPVGQAGDPVSLGNNWVVYRVLEHDPANMNDFPKQEQTVRDALLQQKRQAAYDLFRSSLEARLQREGKLHINEQNLKRVTASDQNS